MVGLPGARLDNWAVTGFVIVFDWGRIEVDGYIFYHLYIASFEFIAKGRSGHKQKYD